MQMRKCNFPTLLKLKICTRLIGVPIPPELVEIIWEYSSAGTISRGEAERHRLALMKDRKISYGPEDEYDNPWVSSLPPSFIYFNCVCGQSFRTFSLCEH